MRKGGREGEKEGGREGGRERGGEGGRECAYYVSIMRPVHLYAT